MDGQNFVVFHNAADDSYGNSTNNFAGAYAATETIDVYFKSALSTIGAGGYDKIVLACTNGEEDRALEQVLSAIGGAKAGGFTVIADDVNSIYAGGNILSVTSITTASAAKVDNVITTTAVRVLTAGESGSTVFVNHAARLITLPAAAAGLNFKFVLGIDATSGMNIVTATAADHFFGTIPLTCSDTDEQVGQAQELDYATAVAAPASYDAMKFVAATATIGGLAGTMISVYCIDDVSWHVDIPNHMTNANDPGQCALIVAR